MPVRVERDIVITVPAEEPGSERQHTVELREADRGPMSVAIHAGEHGSEVTISDLRDALDQAEKEFAPTLRSA